MILRNNTEQNSSRLIDSWLMSFEQYFSYFLYLSSISAIFFIWAVFQLFSLFEQYFSYIHDENKLIFVDERVGDCCLTPNEQFFRYMYTMVRTSYIRIIGRMTDVYIIFINMEHYKIWSHSVGNHFLKLLANLASNYWNLLAKIKFR